MYVRFLAIVLYFCAAYLKTFKLQHILSRNPDEFKSSGRTSSFGSTDSYKLVTSYGSSNALKSYMLCAAQIFSFAVNSCLFSFLHSISAANGGQYICTSEFTMTNSNWSGTAPGLPSYTCRKVQVDTGLMLDFSNFTILLN